MILHWRGFIGVDLSKTWSTQEMGQKFSIGSLLGRGPGRLRPPEADAKSEISVNEYRSRAWIVFLCKHTKNSEDLMGD